MAQFSLKTAINRTDNPTLDGVFEWGRYDRNNLTFNRFTLYRYTDATNADFNNLNINKILAWSAGPEYPHLAFENIQGNPNISPQPFPSEGIYLHPSSQFDALQDNVGVRINVLQDSTFKFLTGSTIQKADNIGDGITYRVVKNGNVNLIPLTTVIQGEAPTPITLSPINVLTGDYIDIIIGELSHNINDDVALNLLIDLSPIKILKPVLRSPLTCSSTSAIVDIPLQTSGTVDLYKGVNLISTAAITANGYNGVANFSGLNLTSGGTYYFVAKNTGQTDSDNSDTFTLTACCTSPSITTQLVSQNLCNTNSTSLSVVAIGDVPLNYQWQKNNVNISGANLATLNVITDGTYKVLVSNNCGTITSNEAVVTFKQSPSGGGIQPAINATVATPYNHTVTFTGTAPFTLSNIVKPAWLSITLAGNVVTISGTPTVGDIGSAEYSFNINNSCGTQSSSSTGGTVVTNCINVGGGTISGNLNPVFNVEETYTLNGLTGTAPFNITAVVTGGNIVSGQGTNTVIVKWTTSGTITFNVSNCGGSGIKTISNNVTIITANTENDNFAIITNNTLTSVVTNNDTVCNGGITTYDLNTNVSHGTLIFNSDGSFQYNNVLNYTGNDSFTYDIKCNGNVVDTSTVNITINPYVADAVNDNFSTPFGVPYTGTVTGNDTSCNSGNTYYKLITGSESNGVVNFNNDGTFVFTPNSLSTGSFQYQILCGTSLANAVLINTATVTINVICSPITNFNIVGDNLSYIDHQETFTLENIDGTPPHTIQWFIGGGNIINGQGTPTVNIVFTQRQNTFVKAIVTNCNGIMIEKIKFIPISLPPCCSCC